MRRGLVLPTALQCPLAALLAAEGSTSRFTSSGRPVRPGEFPYPLPRTCAPRLRRRGAGASRLLRTTWHLDAATTSSGTQEQATPERPKPASTSESRRAFHRRTPAGRRSQVDLDGVHLRLSLTLPRLRRGSSNVYYEAPYVIHPSPSTCTGLAANASATMHVAASCWRLGFAGPGEDPRHRSLLRGTDSPDRGRPS